MTTQARLPIAPRCPDASSPVYKYPVAGLDQNRLNVTSKTRSNIFNWRGQFTPEFVDYILDQFGAQASTIVDPFCGSGTVLVESAFRGLSAYGVELHPAAYAMAKFSTLSSLSQQERLHLSQAVEAHINDVAVNFDDCPLWRARPAFRDRARNLLNLGQSLLDRCDTELQTLLATLVLFEAESMRNGTVVSAVRRAFGTLVDHLLQLPHLDVAPEVYWCDARQVDRAVNARCDLLITSPPYINVFNYHQNHRAIVELLGFDVLRFARSEIGSNRKNRGNRFKTVVQYALDMERCLHAFNRILKRGGTAVVIVGRESRVRGVPFRNGDVITQLADLGGLLHVESLHERQYTNRFGMRIIEDILVLKKRNGAAGNTVARSVAERTLRQALPRTAADVRTDVEEALADLDGISESPLLNGAFTLGDEGRRA